MSCSNESNTGYDPQQHAYLSLKAEKSVSISNIEVELYLHDRSMSSV